MPSSKDWSGRPLVASPLTYLLSTVFSLNIFLGTINDCGENGKGVLVQIKSIDILFFPSAK